DLDETIGTERRTAPCTAAHSLGDVDVISAEHFRTSSIGFRSSYRRRVEQYGGEIADEVFAAHLFFLDAELFSILPGHFFHQVVPRLGGHAVGAEAERAEE